MDLGLRLARWAVAGVLLAAPAATGTPNSPAPQSLIVDRVTLGIGECLRSKIILDASSLEAIYLRPKEILENVDRFWQTDKAYWLTSKWHEDVGYPVPPPGWRQAIEQITTWDQGKAAEILALIDSLSSGQHEFLGKAVTHMCSFLPENKVNLSTTILLTAAIAPNAFQKDFNVVVNATHPDWRKDPSIIRNTIVHEVAHVGFYRNECFMREVQPDNSEQYDVYFNLMNEGMATYIAFTAQKFCPANINDYKLLESTDSVTRSLAELNALLKQVDTLPPDQFRNMMWITGVQRRALYVCGGHMARTIDTRDGRSALVTTMEMGPRSFVAAYNELVQDSLKVYLKELPDTLSPYQRMRQAAVTGDYGSVRRLLALLEDDKPGSVPPPGHALNTAAHLLLNRNELDPAETVFRLYLKLFPKSENPYHGLAAVHVLKGEYSQASEAYRGLLAIAPTNVTAIEMLDLLAGAARDSTGSAH